MNLKEGHTQGAKFKCGGDWKGKSKIFKTFVVGGSVFATK